MSAFSAKFWSFILSIVMGICGLGSINDYDYSDKLENENYVGLKDVYSEYFDIGASMNSNQVTGENAEFIKKNYSSVTDNFEFKQPALNPEKDVWDFKGADAVADFCRQNNIKLRGHCLVWQAISGDSWICFNDDGSLVDKQTLHDRLYHYMDVVINRYRDVIDTWDVVNEVFGYDIVNGEFKRGNFDKIYGSAESWIKDVFYMAREIGGPDLKLYLNDTQMVNNADKFRYMKKYLKKWKDEGVPIDGIGIQGHWIALTIRETGKNLDKVMTAFEDMGYKMSITEANVYTKHEADNHVYETVPRHIQTLQNLKWKQMFEVARKHKDSIESITIWGTSDRENPKYKGVIAHPTVFDENHRPKEQYYAVCDF